MPELAWYSWFNIIGLLALWAFYGFAHMLDKSSKLTRVSHHLVIIVAITFVSGWHFLLQTIGASWLVVGAAVFLLAATAWELIAGTYVIVADAIKPEESQAVVPQTSEPVTVLTTDAALEFDDGAQDLDAGTCHSPENREKLNQAVKGVFSSDSSGVDRIKGIGTLLTLGEDEPEAESLTEKMGYGIVVIAIIGAILLPPCLIAWRAIDLPI